MKKEAAAAEPRAAKDTPTAPDTTHSKPAPDSDSSGYYILGIGSLIVSALGVYYQREAILNALGRNEPTEGVKTIPQPRNEPAEEVKTIPPEKTPFPNSAHEIKTFKYICIYTLPGLTTTSL